jgi:signal transduction histidine kinase
MDQTTVDYDARLAYLEQANSELNSFAAVVTHDLVASLKVISTYADMLLEDDEEPLTPGQADQLAAIRRSAARMELLLEATRRFTQTDAEPELERVALGELVAETLETLAPAIDASEAKIAVTGGLPVVVADRAQLSQLLLNLVSNAIKFGPHGGEVKIATRRGKGAWKISVSDEGPGIAAEDQERIYQPFRRLRGSGKIPGTGLGLTICKRVADNHGGKLSVSSKPGAGATFTFTLPYLQATR